MAAYLTGGSYHLCAQYRFQVFLCHIIGVVGKECLQCIFFIVWLKIENSFSEPDNKIMMALCMLSIRYVLLFDFLQFPSSGSSIGSMYRHIDLSWKKSREATGNSMCQGHGCSLSFRIPTASVCELSTSLVSPSWEQCVHSRKPGRNEQRKHSGIWTKLRRPRIVLYFSNS